MKIAHLMLGNFYIDNYSYQENMLPKFHKKDGYDVEIIASQVSFDENGVACLLEKKGKYYNEHGILVNRLNYKKGKLNQKFRIYEGTYNAIKEIKPDIIFIHGCQFWDIKEIVRYVKHYTNVKIYVDNHADFVNSATNWISKNILHKLVWKKCARSIEFYTKKFYGVLPARVDFLINMYNIPKEKVELLVMGADDEVVNKVNNNNSREKIRDKYCIDIDDFLIVTGGKIDTKKQTFLLMEAIRKIKNESIKLILFGSIIPELNDKIRKLVDGKKIRYIGWINSDESYDYFAAADLVVFPGSHSVFWEQVIGQGIPALFKYWEGMTHVDVGGNCLFLTEGSVTEIKEKIMYIYHNPDIYKKMKEISETKGMNEFSYLKIAQRSIS